MAVKLLSTEVDEAFLLILAFHEHPLGLAVDDALQFIDSIFPAQLIVLEGWLLTCQSVVSKLVIPLRIFFPVLTSLPVCFDVLVEVAFEADFWPL